MKELKFESNLGFQLEAIQSITDIFAGQKVCQSNFTVRQLPEELNFAGDSMGYANSLALLPEEILENVHAIQLRNGLTQSPEAMTKTMNFSIWMETGTGKTYVYLRTIFELNKLYGLLRKALLITY